MTRESAKHAHALISLYKTLYKEKYNKTISLNQYKEKWAMQDVIDSVGYEQSRVLLEYYFKVSNPGHPLQWFYYNFDRLDEMYKDIEKDKIKRAALREATRKMVEEAEANK